jgi:hypothetical protein
MSIPFALLKIHFIFPMQQRPQIVNVAHIRTFSTMKSDDTILPQRFSRKKPALEPMEFKSQPSDLSNRCGKFTVRRAHENFERYSYGDLHIVIFHICGEE